MTTGGSSGGYTDEFAKRVAKSILRCIFKWIFVLFSMVVVLAYLLVSEAPLWLFDSVFLGFLIFLVLRLFVWFFSVLKSKE